MKYSVAIGTVFLLVACATSKPAEVSKNVAEKIKPVIKPDSATFAVTKPVLKPEKDSPKRLSIPASALPSPAPYVAPATPPPVEEKRGALVAQLKQIDSLVTNLQHEVHKDSTSLANKALPKFGLRPPRAPRPKQSTNAAAEGPTAGSLTAKNAPVPSLKVAAEIIKQKPVAPPLPPTPCRWELNTNIIYLGSVLAFASIFFTFLITKKHYEANAKNDLLAGNNNRL